MTEQRPDRAPGYRGALPPRNDAQARPWVIAVIAIVLLIVVLSIAGLPSSLFATPSPTPISSVGPSSSIDLLPSGSVPASTSP
jgi:hypothetical protein